MATIPLSQFTAHIRKQAAAIKKYIEKDAPRLAGIEAVNHFKKSFMDQGFTNSELKPWQPAKRTESNSKWYGFLYGARTQPPRTHPRRAGAKKPYKARKPNPITNYSPAAAKRRTLSGATGDLKESIRYRTEPGRAIVYSNLPYADTHNEGGPASIFGRKSFKMPRRQFIGHSQALNTRIQSTIQADINRLLK